jgi:cobalt-zinc-cadmium efflux system protein
MVDRGLRPIEVLSATTQSRWSDLNRRPTLYESVALPTELQRRIEGIVSAYGETDKAASASDTPPAARFAAPGEAVMTHDHDHDRRAPAGLPDRGSDRRRRLAVPLALTAAYFVAEVIGGLLTNSLALLADAGHMLTDVASLALALFAAWLADRPAPAQRTYGYYRAEILAALANGAALLAACGWIAVEAIERFRSPPQVAGAGMFAVACGGLVVNLIALRVLHGARSTDLNVRGAWLHVIADAFGSAAAIAGAVLVWAFDWRWADPAASLVLVVLVVVAAWRLVSEATGVLMEFAPRGIDVDHVRAAIVATTGVAGLHDLHVWSITPGRACLSVHVVAAPELPRGELLNRINPMLRARFGIVHTTIQVEPTGYGECSDASCRGSGDP